MEEEEDTTTKKRGRKRKPRKDMSPDLNSSMYSDEDSNEGEEKKKKRGRKKKKKENDADEDTTDFQKVFKIVQHLMSSSVAAAFIGQPNDAVYGMSDYYDIITTPMWLKEIERKHKMEEYKTVTEMVVDIRLMLANCYHYWGPCDQLSKKALRLEQMFENKLALLPEEVQSLCSLEKTHGVDIIKEETDEEALMNKVYNNKKGYISKLLCWVVNGRGKSDSDLESAAKKQEALTKARRAERAEKEKELTVWEGEHLLTDGVLDQIASMWEFPVIGQFLHLVYNVLNIDPISHLELERMLLMPQASKTLATLITSMLIPPLFRAKLEVGPAMPYSIWTSRLSTKVASWYRSYHSKGDSTVEVFDSLGIEPQFWLIMGEHNPLDDYQFHELPFLQRVWLLKGLCDFIMHNHKTVQDCINRLEMEELREINLGKDKEGYSYHYFPMFTEVRIYKMAKVPDTKWKDYEAGVEEAITMCAEEEDDEDFTLDQNLIGFARRPHHKPPRSMRPSHKDFKLVCQSLDDIRSLILEFTAGQAEGEATNSKLVNNLKGIVSDLESRESKLELAVFQVRSRMRDEWFHFKNRSEHYIDPGMAYWERKEKEEKAVEEKPSLDLSSIPSTSTDALFNDAGKRERRSRRESSLKLLSREENGGGSDETDEESPLDFDDNSEDEWFASKRDKENKKKKRCMSAKKLKKMSDVSEKMHTTPPKDADKRNIGATVIHSSTSLKPVGTSSLMHDPPVKIKQELPDPDDPGIKSKSFGSVKPNLPTHPLNHPKTVESSKESKKVVPIICKQEIVEEPTPPPPVTNNPSVIQTLVPPIKAPNVKSEHLKKTAPIIPDLSKVKRSNSPDDVVYISDSEDPLDVKPSRGLLVRQFNTNREMETINYSMNSNSQQPMGNFMVQNPGPNQGQFVPLNVNPEEPVFNAQPQMYNVAQPPAQPITYQMPTPQPIVQPANQTMVRIPGPQASRPTMPPNQKFMVLQGNANNINKPPRAQNNNFPTTPTMQSVNWFGGNRGSPRGNANYSPRQRGFPMVVQGQSPRGRGGSPRAPMTPTRGVQRFSGRTPPNTVRTPNSIVRTPTQLGARTPTPMRGRSPVTPVRGPVRNLNFNRSPAKPVTKPVNDITPVSDSPDIEGTLVVSLTDNGGFGYVVMLPDGGKISLTSDQLAKIRSDNGGTLPKTCKVPLNMSSDVFRID